MTRVADSSFLIALFDEDDPRRTTALEWAGDPEPILVPPEVLAETLGVVHARFGYDVADALWQALGTIPHLVYAEYGRVGATAEVFQVNDGALSWVDAAVVAACEHETARPLCFDPNIEAVVDVERA